MIASNATQLTIVIYDYAQAGTYTYTVTNSAGTASSSCIITLRVLPTIISDIASVDALVGQHALLTVDATGSLPLSYAWNVRP
jgi:hypothetical protein